MYCQEGAQPRWHLVEKGSSYRRPPFGKGWDFCFDEHVFRDVFTRDGLLGAPVIGGIPTVVGMPITVVPVTVLMLVFWRVVHSRRWRKRRREGRVLKEDDMWG